MTSEEYYSHGKLLITAEYLVLKGATALALPLKLGQRMKIKYHTDNSNHLFWKSYVNDQPWFHCIYNSQNLDILDTNDKGTAHLIQNILQQAFALNKEITDKIRSASISNYLDFSPAYGLGSSSSLISNIAYWTKVDPFDLLWNTANGSGYDIACARATGPICYTLAEKIPVYSPAGFFPSFAENLYFVYLGRKVQSQLSIDEFRTKVETNSQRTAEASSITRGLINVKSLQEFERLIFQHEKIISGILNRPTIKSQLFSDYWGCVKSLGAWGGDFILATSHEEKPKVEAYFQRKGLSIVFGYNEIVL